MPTRAGKRFAREVVLPVWATPGRRQPTHPRVTRGPRRRHETAVVLAGRVAAMSGIDVLARRWAHGWELHVDGVGVTQTKSLSRAGRDASDFVEVLTGKRPKSVSMTYELGTIDRRIRSLRDARKRASEAQEHAAELSRQLVADLRGLGMTGDDIARVISVSPQRVSQLTAAPRVASTSAAIGTRGARKGASRKAHTGSRSH
jgi:hypothetical protein